MSDIKQIPHHSFFSEPPVLQVKYSVGYTSIHICEIVNKFSINFVPGHLTRALSIACVKTSTFLNQSRHTRTMLPCSLLTQRYICVYFKQQHKEILLSCTLISFFFYYFKSINVITILLIKKLPWNIIMLGNPKGRFDKTNNEV